MNLLHAYILKQSPSAFVNIQHLWPPEGSGPLLNQHLQQVDHPSFPWHDGLAFLLFDEGQDLYHNPILWNVFLKGVSDRNYNPYYIILFCNYGSPSSRPVSYSIGNPPVLAAAAHISLWPGERPVGILLQQSEFDEVMSRFSHPLNLHPDLLDLIFNWTVGHAGAVVRLLHEISYQVSLSCQPQLFESLNSVSQRVSDMCHGVPFTVQAFHDENPLHALVRNLD
jgi:hypothetical protein